MKLAVITDLHANREAVQAVLDHAEQQGAERHAFLGDLVGYGADPAWVVETVRRHVTERGAWAVLGNHDQAVAQVRRPSMRVEAQQVVEWTRGQLTPEQRQFLAALPLEQTLGELLFVHANAWNPAGWDYVQGRLDAVRSLNAASARGLRITFCGHTHEPRLFHLSRGGKAGEFLPVAGEPVPLLASRAWLAIPGAAGQPRDGNPAACYALLETADNTVTWHRVPYDAASAAAKIAAAGLPPALAARLSDGH